MSYAYPDSEFQQWRPLLAVLGSFWNESYEGRDQLKALTEANAQAAEQTMLDLLDVFRAMSRYDVPIFHRDNWYVLYMRESMREAASVLRYGTGALYGGGYYYGQSGTTAGYMFPLPAELREAPLIVNRFAEPSIVWYPEIDFSLDVTQHAITFRTDPFADDRVAVRDIYDGGEIVDREAVLWVFRGQFDWEHIYQQFGYVVGLKMQSSAGYRDLLNAVLDAIVGGTATRDIQRGFAAVTGVPLVIEPTETVEHIVDDGRRLMVITDQHAYTYAQSCAATVVVGAQVNAGDCLTDALQFHSLNRGELPAALPALAMGKGFLATCFYSDLLFENTDVPLEVEENADGFTKVSFGLGGFAEDVATFFDLVHSRGIAAAVLVDDPCDDDEDMVEYPGAYGEASTWRRRGTLAHFLDLRDSPIGEPTAANLPVTINPLQFLIENVLHNNAFLVRVKVRNLGTQALGLGYLRFLQKLIPPKTAMIVVIELALDGDIATIEHIEDSLGAFAAAERLADTSPPSKVAESVSLRLVSGTCQ